MLVKFLGLMRICPLKDNCKRTCTGKCDILELYEEHIRDNFREEEQDEDLDND